MRYTIILLLASALCWAQSQRFDVVAIHEPKSPEMVLSPAGERPGLFITPGQVEIRRMPLASLLPKAFGVPMSQVDVPSRLNSLMRLRYDIKAKMPPNTDAKDVPEMLRMLLVDRFGLKTHRDFRTVDGYVMTVQDERSLATAKIKDGRIPPSEEHLVGTTVGDTAQFAEALSVMLQPQTIIESSQLVEGPFAFFFDRDSYSAAFDYLKRYGLKFQKTKLERTFVVVDAISKPTEN